MRGIVCMCVSWRISLCFIVRLYIEFGWCAYGTCSGVYFCGYMYGYGYMYMYVHVLRVCLLPKIMVRLSEVAFRLRDLQQGAAICILVVRWVCVR